MAEERGLTLRLAVPDTLAMRGDRDLLQQAVANLLDNAVKFSPVGGTVLLGAGFGPDAGSDGQGASAPGGTSNAAERVLRIAVTDGGPGIPAGDLAKAPERFFRGEAARHTPGSGLGLALVQAVAQLHGGALRLADAAPGLRATLSLPAPEQAPALPGPSAPARPRQDHPAAARAGAQAGGRGFIPAPPEPHP